MISVARLIPSRLAHAAALLALLLFGWQGAVEGMAGAFLPVTPIGHGPVTVSSADLTPARTILPLAPVEVAKPAPPEQRPAAASPALLSAVALVVPPRPWRAADGHASGRPTAHLSPPYVARGPPLLS